MDGRTRCNDPSTSCRFTMYINQYTIKHSWYIWLLIEFKLGINILKQYELLGSSVESVEKWIAQKVALDQYQKQSSGNYSRFLIVFDLFSTTRTNPLAKSCEHLHLAKNNSQCLKARFEFFLILRWLDIVITKTLLKNRELKTGWPFLRTGRGNWLTKSGRYKTRAVKRR